LANSDNNHETRVFDVNVLAIFLGTTHPGLDYVAPVVMDGLRGAYVPVLLDVLPMRAYWIMTHCWGASAKESAASVRFFVKTYPIPQYVGLSREAITKSLELAEELNHDVFDCIYLALALQEKATAIVTTDTDFEKLCRHVGLTYINPVPKEILKRFKDQNK
jgi:predicted nucleic acid-binding protein